MNPLLPPHEQRLAEQLEGIDEALRAGAQLLGEEYSPGAGSPQLGTSAAEQRDHHGDGEPRPSAPHFKQIEDGNGKDDDALELDARVYRDISPLPSVAGGIGEGVETGQRARSPVSGMGGPRGSEEEEIEHVSSPAVKNPDSPALSYAEVTGNQNAENALGHSQVDFNGGYCNVDHLPDFGKPRGLYNTENVTLRNREELNENTSTEPKKAERQMQAARIRDLEQRLADSFVELQSVLHESEAQSKQHHEKMEQLWQEYQRNAAATPAPTRLNRASSTLPPSSQLRQAMAGGEFNLPKKIILTIREGPSLLTAIIVGGLGVWRPWEVPWWLRRAP